MDTETLIKIYHSWKMAIVENKSVTFAGKEHSPAVLRQRISVLMEILLNKGVSPSIL